MTPTNTTTQTPTNTASQTMTPTTTSTQTPTRTTTPTPTVTTTNTRTLTPTLTQTPTRTATPTLTQTPSSTKPLFPTGLVLFLDASNPLSYSGSGTNWFDLSGRGNNGTLGTGVSYNSANGGSIVINGTPAIPVSFNNPTGIPFGNSAYTTNFWLKVTTNTQFQGWCSWGVNSTTNANAYRFTNDNPKLIQNYWWDGSNDYNTDYTVPTNTWVNIVYTWNGSNTAILYINGTAYPSKVRTAINVTAVSTDNPLRIGADTLGGILRGNIAFAQIYNTTLTQEQVSNIFNDTKAKFGYT
jgi:hypothetical protein